MLVNIHPKMMFVFYIRCKHFCLCCFPYGQSRPVSEEVSGIIPFFSNIFFVNSA